VIVFSSSYFPLFHQSDDGGDGGGELLLKSIMNFVI